MDGDLSYIGKELCPPLINAIAEVCNQRPTDPIQHIANSLKDYRQGNQVTGTEEQNNTEQDIENTEVTHRLKTPLIPF